MENLERMKFVILLFTCNELLVIGTDSLDCNFDDGLCNWRQDTHDDFNWTIWSGKTPTPDTGPDSDHTSGEGFYVYIDTSKEERNKNAILISPKTSPGQYCFSLWYYMYGEHVRVLVLFTQVGGDRNRVSRVSGEQGQKWILQQTFIDTDEPFEIVIIGRVKRSGDHDLGDIAIDDIVMFSSNRCLADCGDPVPEFGFADSKDIAIGSNVQIACQTGYKITGNPSIVCQANGTWSDRPVCHQVDCGIPTFYSEIIVQKFEGTTYNMSLVLDCSEGFTLIGNAYITCKDDGNWTTQPTCDINNCSDPSPEYGIVNSTSLQYGSVVKVTCIPGYQITGRSLILCQANSSWTDNPVCDPIDCGIPTFNSEIIVQKFEGTTYNMLLVLGCSEGFTLIGNAYITCKDDGNWRTQPTCHINNCSDPSPEYGIVNSTNIQYGSVVKVTCIPGYKITGRSLILCQANSTWTDNPVCDPIDSETSAMVAVYVTIPLIVVVLAVLLTVNIL
ncbi:sushi, von Willebrand factor type A, EGF and pentraxin domain-containing protein 1-like, partial [Mercenaria mercenaria]|uniref:sushi, von Willebrand factor type A, EGF and pentraxin domain-containing protein 1-like n=1 Tax=Mercenaria mercenaria TaxID=6596 RepID=UPI00234F3B6A